MLLVSIPSLFFHWSKVLVGVAGRENFILVIFNFKVISNENSSWTDSVLKHINMHSNSKMYWKKDYCCLQFSFFSLGLERPDLSVCRFVGGMKVGSSRKSCKPECGMGSDWLVGPILEGKRMWVCSYCFNSFILSEIFPVYSTCLSHPEALCALPSGLEGRVQLFRDVSDMLGLSVNAAVVSQHTKKMTDIWFHVYFR